MGLYQRKEHLRYFKGEQLEAACKEGRKHRVFNEGICYSIIFANVDRIDRDTPFAQLCGTIEGLQGYVAHVQGAESENLTRKLTTHENFKQIDFKEVCSLEQIFTVHIGTVAT